MTLFHGLQMKRSIRLIGAALLLAGCASGADVAEDQQPATDTSALEAIDDDPPARDAQAPGAAAP